MLTVKGESLPYIPCDWCRIYIRSREMREGRRVEWYQLCGLRQPIKLEKPLQKLEPDRTHKKLVISSKHGPVGNPMLCFFVITIGYLAANQQMISNTVVYTNSRETFVVVCFKPCGLNLSLCDNPCPSDLALWKKLWILVQRSCWSNWYWWLFCCTPPVAATWEVPPLLKVPSAFTLFIWVM